MAAIEFDRLRAQGRRFVSGFTPGQKAVTVVGVTAIVLAGYMFTKWAATPEYSALYTNLDSASAGEVTAELDSRNVSYKLSDGGRTILVPKQDVYQTRVELSAQGLPAGNNDGYALLDKGGITKSEFIQRVDYQRALEGELGRTIEAIDSVQAATVHLTIPKETVFVGSDEDRPSAAVLVSPRGNQQLGSETVQAIVHLVSSSVADMTSDEVTVADSMGNVLAAPGKSSDFAASQQLERKVAFEDDLAKSVTDLVAASLGPGHAAVTVQADLDLSETETHRTTFQQPNNIALPRISKTVNETFTGPGSPNAGVLGPDGTPLATDSTPTNYSKTQAEQEFALDQIEEQINKAPGGINKLSVSVLLDSKSVDAGAVAQWTGAISAAAGIDATRNDVIQVTRVPFDKKAQQAAAADLKAATGAQSKNMMLDLVRHVVTFAIVGLVLFLASRSIKRAEANRPPIRVPLDLRELEAGDLVAAGLLDASRDPARLPRAQRPVSPLEPAALPVETEISDLIERQPDEVAQTLRSWLADRRV